MAVQDWKVIDKNNVFIVYQVYKDTHGEGMCVM